MTLMETKHLTLSYDGAPILEDLSFAVEEGDYLCIIGENGTGKSTLVKALLGILPATSGTISYSQGLRHNQIGYLPQKVQISPDFPAIVWEVVLSGCLNQKGLHPFYTKKDKDRARQSLAMLNAEELAKARFTELSGGQQQRVLIARALCATDKVLLLDEPTTGLDPEATQELYKQIEHLHRRHGITVIMITHDLAAVTAYATKVLRLEANGYECQTQQGGAQ